MSEAVDFPRAWRFHSDEDDADGAVFEGRFTGIIEQGETAYGTKPVARFVEAATGEEVSIWLFNQSLLDQLSKLAPEKDELVRVEWRGKKTSKTSGRKYQAFKASAPERPVVQLSWGDLAVEEETEEDEF
jgi:hypothetical protein